MRVRARATAAMYSAKNVLVQCVPCRVRPLFFLSPSPLSTHTASHRITRRTLKGLLAALARARVERPPAAEGQVKARARAR